MPNLKTTTTQKSITSVIFAPETTFSVGVGNYPDSVSVADVNGDSKLDIVTANGGNYNSSAVLNNNVSVLLGDGKGTFAPLTTFLVGSRPYSVNVVDVNGDRKLDIVTANSGSKNISVLLGDGKGSFAAQKTFTVGYAPNSVDMVDMNNDSKLDMVAVTGNNISVLLGDGKGNFAVPTTFARGVDYSSAMSAVDVNGDGKLDVVTANPFSNNVSVFLNISHNNNNALKGTVTITGILERDKILTVPMCHHNCRFL